jgi:hypothetical protein
MVRVQSTGFFMEEALAMCGDKDRGTFLVFTASDYSTTDFWPQDVGPGRNGTTPTTDSGKIYPAAGNPIQRERETKFKEGIEKHCNRRWSWTMT